MEVEVEILNAFTLNDCGGNPAGVVLNADDLSDSQMQCIANRVGLSETAFVMGSIHADRKIRFFTPSEEVGFCGHAIVAVYGCLLEKGVVEPGVHSHEVRDGVLPVEVGCDGAVTMRQHQPIFGAQVLAEDVAELLQIPARWLENPKLPIQFVSTGLKDLIVAIDSKEHLEIVEPNFQALADFSKKTDSVGLHLFCLASSGSDLTAHCRNFAPAFAINEESATGSSCGALAAYITRYLDRDKSGFSFLQGEKMGSASKINAVVDPSAKQVTVSGSVTWHKQLTLSV